MQPPQTNWDNSGELSPNSGEGEIIQFPIGSNLRHFCCILVLWKTTDLGLIGANLLICCYTLTQVHVLDYSPWKVRSKYKFLIRLPQQLFWSIVFPHSRQQYALSTLMGLIKTGCLNLNLSVQTYPETAKALLPRALIKTCAPGPVSLSVLTSLCGPTRHAWYFLQELWVMNFSIWITLVVCCWPGMHHMLLCATFNKY